MKARRFTLGFTLIELLLSLAIAAMLAAALHAAMSTAYRAKKTAEAAIEPTRGAAVAMEIICSDLAAAPPLPSSTDTTTTYLRGPFTGTHQASGSGDNDDLQFRTLTREEGKDDDPLSDGIKGIEYLVLPDAQSPTLIRRVTRNLLTTQDVNTVDETICRNVHGLTFQYYDGTTWQTDWDSTALGDVLPLAVKVTIQLNDPTATSGATPGVREFSRVVPMACSTLIQPTTN
jgi:type II secretion system protein J